MTNSSPVSSPSTPLSPYENLSRHLKELRLSNMLSHWETIENKATQEQWSYAQFLLALCELELQRRVQARQEKALREAQLPSAKSFTSFDFSHCKQLNPAPLMQLAQDHDVARAGREPVDIWVPAASARHIYQSQWGEP